ncbi:ABC transporter ATP-binding protein [Candidatus Latescibacterota bacterium]
MLEIKDLSKYYTGPDGIIHAVEDVAVSVGNGEFVAVQGPSGCGKTTLLLAAGGLLAPDSGTVLINGKDPYGMSPDDRALFRASKIGFVFQQFYLIPYLTVKENILAPSIALPDPDAPSRAEELMERFNITDRADHIPSELSTGERQRTALARAILNNQNLLLADEPTGNLDSENAGAVLRFFAEFAESGGSVLMVTHSEGASEFAHRSVHLERGKITPCNS